MRRWMAAPLILAVAAALTLSPPTPVYAQNAPAEETFLTADGIQLHGLFHKSDKSPGNDPVVVLMYPPGKGNDMLKGDWKGLADRLTKEGYNVFRFDWRGHGKSFDIKDTAKFWTNPVTGQLPNGTPLWNMRYINGANKRPVKDTFFVKDLTIPASYMPVYLNDLAAVRVHLDGKNDAGEVNTSTIYLIGSESAATLGFIWLSAEWNRPSTYPTPNELGIAPRYEFVPQQLRILNFDTGGSDIGGAIWLSPERPQSIPEVAVKTSVTGLTPGGGRLLPLPPKTRDNNPMLFLFSGTDKAQETQASFFNNQVLVAKGDKGSLRPLNPKYWQPLQKAATLKGVGLLGDDDQHAAPRRTLSSSSRHCKRTARRSIEETAVITSPITSNWPRLDS